MKAATSYQVDGTYPMQAIQYLRKSRPLDSAAIAYRGRGEGKERVVISRLSYDASLSLVMSNQFMNLTGDSGVSGRVTDSVYVTGTVYVLFAVKDSPADLHRVDLTSASTTKTQQSFGSQHLGIWLGNSLTTVVLTGDSVAVMSTASMSLTR